MARAIRKSGVREIPLSEVKDDLSRYLREAGKEEIIIPRHGKPAGVLVGFESEEDWFDYRLENDPRFLRRIEQARNSLQTGRGIKLEEFKRNNRAHQFLQTWKPRSRLEICYCVHVVF